MKKLFEAPDVDILKLNVREKMMVDEVSEIEYEGEEDELG